MKWKPEDKQTRMIITSEPHRIMPESRVTVVIGPFDGFMDKPELMDALKMVVRGSNFIPGAEG